MQPVYPIFYLNQMPTTSARKVSNMPTWVKVRHQRTDEEGNGPGRPYLINLGAKYDGKLFDNYSEAGTSGVEMMFPHMDNAARFVAELRATFSDTTFDSWV